MEAPVTIERERVLEVPLLVARPRWSGEFPLILALHGLTGNKETMLPLIGPLAASGFVVAAPDARFHGERLDAAWMRRAQTNETESVTEAVLQTAAELPGLVSTLLAWDGVRPGEDGGAGIAGVSMGALTLYAAIPLESRFTVAVSLIGGGIFARPEEPSALLSPEARAERDARDIRNHLAAFARVALLLLAGENDTRLPAAATQALYDALAPRVPDPARLRLVIEPSVGHTVTPAMGMETIGWFRRWLR